MKTPIVNRILKDKGYDAYVVGGAVRDFYLKKSIHDIDITTNANLTEIMHVFKEYAIIETGLKHDTVTVVIDGVPYEITSFRNGAQSISEDVQLRDFTINGLAYDDGILDTVGGISDLDNGIIRCINDPVQRFKEDPLRILRAMRFASTYGFTVEPKTKQAMHNLKSLLDAVAKERIQSEFTQILCGEHVEAVLRTYRDIVAVIIPEIEPMFDFEQFNPHHMYDVYEHTLRVIAHTKPQPIQRLAAFFHDAGKPKAFTQDINGIGHFYKHELYSADIVDAVMRRLKYDHKTWSAVKELVLYHDNIIQPQKKSVRKVLNKIGVERFDELIDLKRADNLGQSPQYRNNETVYQTYREIAATILSDNDALHIKDLKIGGRDLIRLGIEPGPRHGEILKVLLDATINEDVKNTKEDLEAYVTRHFLTISQRVGREVNA
ncbi:CCA tRNA nucleotidyltransferase [Erysipelothrix sp. HDW6C]|uniref:CCA tRNA nucleotidyltransferase n=1 Tax=Erysipelothrix sp. HDW6C TaxID=2714930 RepID=UPI001407958D|nr:CCA tRNA nucleotidyltransferase [Erysipelothrix sp. HDW6C]QIK69240.1 CCA tRNA nucleotidyltransferase [Erysipelothrix sp. HDW6C]